jgi:hypothetical protein
MARPRWIQVEKDEATFWIINLTHSFLANYKKLESILFNPHIALENTGPEPAKGKESP